MDMVSGTVVLQALIYGFLNGVIYGLISIGFTMTFGVMKIVNFAYGQLTVVSMYITLFLYEYYKIDPFVCIVFIIPFFFFLGVVIYKSALRWMLKSPHHIQMIVTLGFMIFFESIMLLIFSGTPRAIITPYSTSMISLSGGLKVSIPRLMATILAVFVIGLLFIFLKRTVFGKKIESTADDEEGAMLVGIETQRVFMVAFAIACVLEGIAGSAIMTFSVVDPYTGFTLVIKAFMVVVVAGLGSIPGAIVGGLIVGVVEALASVFISASLGTGVLFLILAFVLIFKPSGMFGTAVE
jgi:branched-chain amino acid transport system permease protein